jgi:1-acyl-sn-glycerol-3-phosphate acyltransferase
MLDDASQQPSVRPAVSERSRRVEILTQVCTDDLLSAFGLGELRYGRYLLRLISRIPVRRLARQVATYDEITGESGLAAGGAWALERMARHLEVEGLEKVPREGPLLLAANHPGLSDAVVLFATTPRADLRVLAAERPFLTALPKTSRYLLTVPEQPQVRFRVIKTATRHLRGGGAVLTFPGGKIEPDPAVMPGAVEALKHWSASVDLFARLVPDLVVVPVIVSGVLSPTALRNPLTLLRRRKEDRDWLAATIQMMMPALRNVTTRIAFGRPIHADDSADMPVSRATLGEARRLIEQSGAGRC